MKERPILFSGPMVRAILAGTKTQTRRIVKPQPPVRGGASVNLGDCPYGALGDRLWVREAWRVAQFGYYGPGKPESEAGKTMINYRADNHKILFPAETQKPIKTMHGNWRPSIFMPRWACRLVLEITSIGVWRLQDISEGDAIREGMNPANGALGDDNIGCSIGALRYAVKDGKVFMSQDQPWPVRRYRVLWNQLNAKRGFGWDKNPWVWDLTFKRVK